MARNNICVHTCAALQLTNRQRSPAMADLFQRCLDFTLTQEGGFVDDPYDPGGATNMGITLATYRSWDHDPALGIADVRAMSRQTAAAIYYAMYWSVLGGQSLPAGIDLSVF